MTNDAPQPAIQALHKAFCNVAQAQVSLLRVNPRTAPKDLLALYERVGAGGTPLTAEERLFSIYKHHVPEIRKSVDTIHEEAGRVLSHVKIAAAGLRVANASKKHPSYSVPSVADFSRQMEDPYSELRQNLEHLIPPGAEKRSRFCESFSKTKRLLSCSDGVGAFSVPDVLLAGLPAGLWQVLVFWASSLSTEVDIAASRKEAVRFALFWLLCVWNDDKAASWCFEYIRKMEGDRVIFPGADLYRLLSGNVCGLLHQRRGQRPAPGRCRCAAHRSE